MKTLTDITSYTDYVEKLCALFDNDEDETPEVSYPLYDTDKFLDEVYMDEDSYNTLVALVRTKKNVILQGAPGVDKTYAAKRLAYSMMGVKNQERVMMIQFHQSYSYEDFIELDFYTFKNNLIYSKENKKWIVKKDEIKTALSKEKSYLTCFKRIIIKI